jgi:GTP cyclohydrolase I
LWDVGGDGASQRDRQRVVSALSHRILENGTLIHQIAKIALRNSLDLDGRAKKPAAVHVAMSIRGYSTGRGEFAVDSLLT